MTGTGAADVLARLLHDWQQAFNGHDPDEIAVLFSQDALFQGISPQLRRGPQEISDYYARVTHGTTAQVVDGIPSEQHGPSSLRRPALDDRTVQRHPPG